jgi:hypothetical protein
MEEKSVAQPSSYPGIPRWVKIFTVACFVGAVIFVIVHLAGGMPHVLDHGAGGSAPSPPATRSEVQSR